MNSEYDVRQLVRMNQLFKSFEDDKISLSSLISSMEFLFHAMENVEENW